MDSTNAAEVYCGPAPVPGTLWQSWNFDPFLLAILSIAAIAYGWKGPHRSQSGLRLPAAAAGALLLIAFVSPLCALSAALFSARIAHHVLLIAFAAPLIALAWPRLRSQDTATISLLFLAHSLLVWLWHAPQIYAFALSSDQVYWLMEISLLGSAVFLWRAIFSAQRSAIGAALAALLGSIVQMGLLGALITFAKRPLYAHHLTTTDPFGLSALADQQLAGLIMWVPAALPYLLVALVLSERLLRRHSRAAADDPASM